MAITPFKVIQGHRFWYQSKAHIRFPISLYWLIPTYLLSCTVSKTTADYVKFSLTTGGRYSLTPSLGWSPANIPTSDIPLKTRFFQLHFTRRMYSCIFNHFCVIRPKSYRIRRNNANYTTITPFKVIQGHWFLYQSKAYMRLPISNLSPILHRFQVMADYCYR